jgi:hypothetical protein
MESKAAPAKQTFSERQGSIEYAKRLFESMKAERSTFNNHYQAIAELCDGTNAEFNTTSKIEGEFKVDQVYESKPAMASQVAGAALMGLMWNNGARSIKVELAHKEAKDDQVAKDWMQESNEKFAAALDDPLCNLNNAIGEFGEDIVKYGTTTITRSPTGKKDGPVFQFDCWNVQNFYIGEGADRQPDTIAITYRMSVEEMVKRFTYEKCHANVQKQYDAMDFAARVEYMQLIQPRLGRPAGKKGAAFLPVMSAHYDMTNAHKLKEGGFARRAFYTARFYRRPGKLYAYSPAMNALPDIYLANALKEAIIVATEKQLDPPLGVLDDAVMGNAVIDTSAGGVSVFNPSGAGGQPVFPIFSVGELKSAMELLERLMESISQHFFLDRLLDFNNQVQMTAREALMRDSMRSTTLRTPISRMTSDVFLPLIQDSFMDMLDMGYFGLMPGSVEAENAKKLNPNVELVPDVIAELLARGEKVFEVKFMTPAMRDNQAQEAQAIIEHLGIVTSLAPAYPEARHTMDIAKSLRRLADMRLVPSDIQTTESDATTKQTAEQQQAEQQASLQAMGQWSQIGKNLGVTPGGQ